MTKNLLLVIGDEYKEYQYCNSVEEIKNIITNEKPSNYEIAIKDDECKWEKILVIIHGRVVPGYDKTVIPELLHFVLEDNALVGSPDVVVD